MSSRFTSYEAKQFITKGSGQRYDPKIVELFIHTLDEYERKEGVISDFKIISSKIKVGMRLTRDLFTSTGLLLMHEGQRITKAHINYINIFERLEGENFDIYVKPI